MEALGSNVGEGGSLLHCGGTCTLVLHNAHCSSVFVSTQLCPFIIALGLDVSACSCGGG